MSYSLSFSQAILIVVYIADKVQQGIFDFVPTKQISESLNLTTPTTVKILQSLNKKGVIETHEGAKGGVRLQIEPEKVTLLDIFDAVEYARPLFKTHKRINATGARPTRAQQGIQNALNIAEESMKNSLNNVSIADILRNL
ncbi:MAG: RrF2 family transcriptional regulator [Stygiobacter sp.]